MSYHPVFIDGPYKRKRMIVDRFPFVVAVMKPFSMTEKCRLGHEIQDSFMQPAFDTVTYYMYPLKFGKHILAVASVNPAQPDEDAVLNILLTKYARESVMV